MRFREGDEQGILCTYGICAYMRTHVYASTRRTGKVPLIWARTWTGSTSARIFRIMKVDDVILSRRVDVYRVNFSGFF